MASAWKYGNTMKADIKKTINKIIFTQATTFSKALIKKLNTTPWGRSVKQVQWESESDSVGLDPNAQTADVHRYSRNMEKTTFCCDDRRHINILLHKSNMTVLILGFSVWSQNGKCAVAQSWSHSWVVVTISCSEQHDILWLTDRKRRLLVASKQSGQTFQSLVIWRYNLNCWWD